MQNSYAISASTVLPVQEAYDYWGPTFDRPENPLAPLLAFEQFVVDQYLKKAVDGAEILDAGCGTGRHTLRLAAAGAHVTGLDFSCGMLQVARGKCGDHDIRFVEHDLAKPLPFEPKTFDTIVCGLVLEHVLELRPVFEELARVCHPGGMIVITARHPAMNLRGPCPQFVDPATGRTIRVKEHHHQVLDYVFAAVGALLLVESAGEYLVDRELVEMFPEAPLNVGDRMLLAMQLRKPKAPRYQA